MKKIKMSEKISALTQELTLAEGCEKHRISCQLRNLSKATIEHYQSSYTPMLKFFGDEFLVCDITIESFNDYKLHLCNILDNDITIHSYLVSFIAIAHFFMKNKWCEEFEMQNIKKSKHTVETYNDTELKKILRKPNIKKCSFIEYQCWVISNILLCTGIRRRSLMNLKVKDVDFDNSILHVNVTKNRKPLILPLNATMLSILKEFLLYRQYNNSDDWLFCNAYGRQLKNLTCWQMIARYNESRGVETTGIHRYRHTFAKQWILSGGSVVTLSKLLGHSSLTITENYLNLLVSDYAKEVDEINILDKYSNKTIKMRR